MREGAILKGHAVVGVQAESVGEGREGVRPLLDAEKEAGELEVDGSEGEVVGRSEKRGRPGVGSTGVVDGSNGGGVVAESGEDLAEEDGDFGVKGSLVDSAAQVVGGLTHERGIGVLDAKVGGSDAGAVESLEVARRGSEGADRLLEAVAGGESALLADGDGLAEVERGVLPAGREVDDVGRGLHARERAVARIFAIEGREEGARGGEGMEAAPSAHLLSGGRREPALGTVRHCEPSLSVRVQRQASSRRPDAEDRPRIVKGAPNKGGGGHIAPREDLGVEGKDVVWRALGSRDALDEIAHRRVIRRPTAGVHHVRARPVLG